MTREEMLKLQPGDIVRHVSRADALVVVYNDGQDITAVRAEKLSNPPEWKIIRCANFKQ